MNSLPSPPDSASARTPRPEPSFRLGLLVIRWWLLVALVVSVLVHLILFGIIVPHLSLFPSPEPVAANRTGGAVSVELRGAPDQGDIPAKTPTPHKSRKSAAQTAPKAAPSVAETPDEPHSQPVPTKAVAQPKTVPQPESVPQAPATPQPQPVASALPVQPQPQAPVRPVTPKQSALIVAEHTPQTIAIRPTPRMTSGFLPNHLEAPLTRGDLAGNPEIEPRTRDLLPITATPSPLPPRIANTTEGRGGGGGGSAAAAPTVTDVTAAPSPAAGTSSGIGGTEGGSGGGEGGGRGTSHGAGNAATGNGDFGISRGIPFGDRLGITNGNPRGGGGTGGGMGGASGGGGQHFTLGRKSGGGGAAVHIVYVLDVSGSMDEGGKIESARDAMHKALEELRPEDSFNIILFSDAPRLAYPSLRQASAFYVSNGKTQVDLATPRGATNMSSAMTDALSQEGATHIFLMSDGEPTDGVTDFIDLRAFIREHNSSHARIITLALGLGENFKGMALLKSIAEENNGFFRYVNLSKK